MLRGALAASRSAGRCARPGVFTLAALQRPPALISLTAGQPQHPTVGLPGCLSRR